MTFAIVLFGTVIASLVLRNAILKAPLLFYGLAVGVVIFYAYATVFEVPYLVWRTFFILIQKSMLPLALFVVVMYIGCFSKSSRISLWLRPIRAELSIIASLLVFGHMIVYLNSYLPNLFGSGLKTNVMLAFVVALILLLLVLVLGITSFNTIKKKMNADTWISVQKWAYVFFGLTYIHLLLMLLPAALRGGQTAQVSVAVYSIVFIVYAVWRIVIARLDKKASQI